MRWEIVDDQGALARRAADLVIEPLQAGVPLVLGLGTDEPTEGVLALASARVRQEALPLRGFHAFSLQEVLGSSGPFHLVQKFFPGARFSAPDPAAASLLSRQPELHLDEALTLECHAYDEALARSGSLTLTLLVLKPGGWLAFNRPGTPVSSRTHAFQQSGRTCVTLGIRSILESDSILLLAQGASVAEAVRRLQEEPASEAFPVSALKSHPDVTLLLDRPAASLLRTPSKDYLEK